ncbi:protein of unknown function [Rhodovastum atsumiense]|nr:protein of unknown function [Rhodovastum atsumiense]
MANRLHTALVMRDVAPPVVPRWQAANVVAMIEDVGFSITFP